MPTKSMKWVPHTVENHVNKTGARKAEQRQRYLRARAALALYTMNGHVPQEAEIDQAYQLICAFRQAGLEVHTQRAHGRKRRQLGLF
jgi:hypothetical protein